MATGFELPKKCLLDCDSECPLLLPCSKLSLSAPTQPADKEPAAEPRGAAAVMASFAHLFMTV